MSTPPGLSMNRRSNLPPFDACTSTSSYPRPATAGSITASSVAMDGHAGAANKKWAEAHLWRGALVRRSDALERSQPIVKMDASRQFFKVFRVEQALNADRVFAFDLVARVHQAVGELAGIGQQQQPRAVDIQPTHRHPPAWRQPRKHGRTSFRVTAGHQLAHGLVIHQDASRPLGEQACDLAVDSDLVRRERTVAKLGGPPGDAHPAGFDPGLDFAPRAMTGRSQELLQPLRSEERRVG